MGRNMGILISSNDPLSGTLIPLESEFPTPYCGHLNLRADQDTTFEIGSVHMVSIVTNNQRAILISSFRSRDTEEEFAKDPLQPPESPQSLEDGVDLSDDILTFCRQQGIVSHARSAIAMVRQSFPFLRALDVRLDSDPEEEGEWIVIEVTAEHEVGCFLRAYDECARLWIERLPANAIRCIRLSYALL